VNILVDDLSGPAIAAFLDEHVRQMRAITPLESKHALDLDALRHPDITMWSAYDGDELVGCAALRRLSPTHGELKSMRTRPSRARAGIATTLLTHLLTEAAARGWTRLSLETGTDPFFAPARKLYEKFGFTYCGPFDGYTASPHNTFMTRTVHPVSSAS
jgi:putative acetyltransferase